MNTDTLFQSTIFGEFQKTIPYRGKVWELVVKNSAGKISASCLVIRQKLSLGFSWLWVPYGPLFASDNEEASGDFKEIFEQLEDIAKKERAIFVRIEPIHTFSLPQAKFLSKKFRIQAAARRYTPEDTLHLNLEQDEDALLLQMKPKGRYNIKVAQKNEVEVMRYDDFSHIPEKDFDDFYDILRGTGERDDFGIHPKEFYKNLLTVFGTHKASSLFLAYSKKKKVIAGIIITYYKNTATYYYGASHYDYRNLMGPYLLQWEAIREAKRRGYKIYDFLGIAAQGHQQNHPWAGVTEFKVKFGGNVISYPSAFLIIFKPYMYRLMHLLRRTY